MPHAVFCGGLQARSGPASFLRKGADGDSAEKSPLFLHTRSKPSTRMEAQRMVAACRRQLGLGLAAWLRAASTAGRIFQCGSLRYAAAPQWLGTTGVPRGGRWTVVVGLYGFATWLDVCRAVDARRHHHLGIYLHQITLLGPGPVTWRDSSLHRLACLAVQAHVTSSAKDRHAPIGSLAKW